FRLNGVTMALPPLRERVGEIAGLASSFIATAWRGFDTDEPPPALADAALAMLESYAWPGNIRELRNFVERAMLVTTTGTIQPEHWRVDGIAGRRTGRPLAETIKREVECVEKQQTLDALAQCAETQPHAAKLLGISRATLVNRLDRYEIKRPRKPRG